MEFNEISHSLSLKRKNYFNELLYQTDLNMMELDIIYYLANNPEKNTFTEIQKWKDYSKSHISTSITHLINKGYIIREVSEKNKKIHHLKLQETSDDIIIELNKCQENYDNDVFKNISKQDKQKLFEILNKMSNNLKD